MTNREYYKTEKIAQTGYDYYPNWNVGFEEWLDIEHVSEMPSIYGSKGYPFYTATYEEAEKYSKLVDDVKKETK